MISGPSNSIGAFQLIEEEPAGAEQDGTRSTQISAAAQLLASTPDEIAAGHCVALGRPKELADMLVG